MIGFLSGAAVAVLLGIGTWIGMTNLYVPTEIRYSGPHLHLGEELVDETVGGE